VRHASTNEVALRCAHRASASPSAFTHGMPSWFNRSQHYFQKIQKKETVIAGFVPI